MAGNPDLMVGDAVMIHFNPKDISVVPEMMKFNNTESEITKIHKTKAIFGKQYGRQYECKDVESSFGIPFIFTRDMLFTEGDGWYD